MDFEKERARLIAEIAENLAKCVTSANQLNRNIENVTIVGSGFVPLTTLWQQFENVMESGGGGGGNTGNTEERIGNVLPPQFPFGTDETAVVGSSVAPGGGQSAVAPVLPMS